MARSALPLGKGEVEGDLLRSFNIQLPLGNYIGDAFDHALNILVYSCYRNAVNLNFRACVYRSAVMFHGAHNIYVQKIFTPLTTRNGHTQFWIDEYGLMVPIIVTLMAVYFWRRARAEGL